MSCQTDAIRKLLRDDDPETVRLVREQLLASGEEAAAGLRELCGCDDERVSAQARELLGTIDGRGAVEDFELMCHFFGNGIDLEQACWALARAIEPSQCQLGCRHRLTDWGRQFLMRIAGAVSTRERVQVLSAFMADELTFRGNAENYYCERNSLLPRVIETRAGIPITLTVLYMMVASRAGMKVEGINLPGHFIARHGDVYFDPFHRGRILTLADIEQILARQGIALQPSHLDTASCRQILVRILANLAYVYDRDGRCDMMTRVREWIGILSKQGAAE